MYLGLYKILKRFSSLQLKLMTRNIPMLGCVHMMWVTPVSDTCTQILR